MAISKSDQAAFRRIASQFGRMAAGVKKTLTPLALDQRRAAAKASVKARLARSKKRKRKREPKNKRRTSAISA